LAYLLRIHTNAACTGVACSRVEPSPFLGSCLGWLVYVQESWHESMSSGFHEADHCFAVILGDRFGMPSVQIQLVKRRSFAAFQLAAPLTINTRASVKLATVKPISSTALMVGGQIGKIALFRHSNPQSVLINPLVG